MTLREIMTKRIKDYGPFDFFYRRGDNEAYKYKNYELWLNSLNDEDFLAIYHDITEKIGNLD